MNSTDYRATAVLTEHLGYPPLKLIDDVINAVNHIAHECVVGTEKYLEEKESVLVKSLRQKEGRTVLVKDYRQEVESGVAKLETLLDSEIDKNFDKFELYAFRNILTIPRELVDGGWIRLKHHEGIDFANKPDTRALDDTIKQLVDDISYELHLRKILQLQLAKAHKIVNTLHELRRVLQATLFLNASISPESKAALKSLEPFGDNLRFVVTQVNELMAQVLHINAQLASRTFAPTIRDEYIRTKTTKLLQSVGIEPTDPQLPLPQASPEEVDALRHINELLR